MLDAIRVYLNLLDNPPEELSARLSALAEILDRLAITYHQTPDVESDTEAAMPDGTIFSYQDLRARIGPRFPELGLYATIEPSDPTKLQGTVGDAIDDLVDIARDLHEVVWRSEHVGLNDAMWHFRFNYLIHWGQHLMELRVYIHFLMRQEHL